MSDPMNDPEGPYNEDADRQSNTAPDADDVEAPEALPWEANPAVERPAGNYETLEEASGASEPSTSAVDDTPATDARGGVGDPPVTQPGTVTAPTSQATATGDVPADSPAATTADEPAASDQTVHTTESTEYEPE